MTESKTQTKQKRKEREESGIGRLRGSGTERQRAGWTIGLAQNVGNLVGV